MTVEASTDGIIWKAILAIATAVGSIIAFLFARVIRKHDEEIAAIRADIKGVSEKVDGKADLTEQMRMRVHIDKLFEQSRTDKEAVLNAIGDLKNAVIDGLGQRPTRDELSNTGSHRRRGYDKP